MSEESKKQEVVTGENPAAKRGKKPTEKVEGPSQKTFTEAEVNAILAKASEQAAQKAVEAYIASHPVQPTTYIRQDEQIVSLLYMGACVDGSTVTLWKPNGIMQGRGGMLDIPKSEFLHNLNPDVLKRLKDRRLVVLNGLSDEERERYGVAYSDGELVSQDVYYKLLDYDEGKVVSIFQKACFRHKQLIATLFAEAYNNHDNRIRQTLIQKLQKASKAVDKDGMFTAILKDMARALGDSE